MFSQTSILSNHNNSLGRNNNYNTGRRRKLYCVNGQYLEISHNGLVKGTRNYHSPHVVLELVPVARDLIHIKGVHTGYYLAVDRQGEVYTTDMENDECIFRESLTRNFYDNYCSYKHSNKSLALGLERSGVAIAVSRTVGSQREDETRFITKVAF